jgi:hypothetical protein
MTTLTKTITYAVQRGWAPEWGWHWLIIDTNTRENVGLLFEGSKTLEIQQVIVCDGCGNTTFNEDGFCNHCGREQ